MNLWSCCANECAHVSAGAANAGAVINARDIASVVIHHGDSGIHDIVVPVQKKATCCFVLIIFLNGKPTRSTSNSSGYVHNVISLCVTLYKIVHNRVSS